MGIDSYDLMRERIAALGERFSCFALIHEAALVAWGLTYSRFTRCLDVLIPHEEFARICPDECRCDSFFSEDDMRVWDSDTLLADDFRNHLRWSGKAGCFVLEPQLVLELLPLSPDIQYLLEDRARLAMVLYADEMTDEELLEFNRYVRGI